MKRSLFSLVLVFTLLLGLAVPAAAADAELEAAVSESASYMLQTVQAPQVGSIGGEWAVLGLARSGYDVPQAYWDAYYAAVEKYVRECEGVLHTRKYTEYSRVILALTAIGANPSDVAGYNLLTPLGDFNKTIWQGINGPIWALLALDSGSYDMPINAEAETQATRQMYIDEILRRQLDDGGWNLADEGGAGASDPDITGMALQALAKYQEQTAVKTAIDRALTCLSGRQEADGGFSSYNVSNSESIVQVIVALCELGVSLDDNRFVKNGATLLDALLNFRLENGSFMHVKDGGRSDQMASEQGLLGIVAALRAAGGENSFYRMDDAAIRVSGSTLADAVGLPGKHADVRRLTVNAPGVTFADIAGHANQAAIEALAARGVINGMGDGSSDTANTFVPDETMTRAQFATIVVRALGLAPAYTGAFTDVPAEKWYAPYVDAAASYGLINGRGNGIFDPETTITRQEAAVLVTRAAALCGMDTELDNAAVRDVLAQFGDYVKSEDYTRPGLAFCYNEGILDASDLDIRPLDAILRCEIAQMIYNLLGCANLV